MEAREIPRDAIETRRLSIAFARASLAIRRGDGNACWLAPRSASRGLGFEDRVKSFAIKEAYRIITIREGDRVEKVPVIQAIMRKLAFAAANGNIRAQQMYLNLLTSAEADRARGRNGDS
jgi:hypothetical protein